MKRVQAYLVYLLAAVMFYCSELSFASGVEEERLAPRYVARLSIIPGIGQFYNKKRIKAWTIIGLETGAIVGTLVMHDYQINAYRDWEATAENDLKKRNAYRERLEDLRKIRNTFIWAGGLLWVYNIMDAYVDAHFYKFDQRRKESKKSGFYLIPGGVQWEKYF